ncbi:MAG TPA: cyanophycinase [Flavisolibacter sp.]|jgi:cyanophycinase|nr:cyanophycinase [Flavisolibacter sp.]
MKTKRNGKENHCPVPEGTLMLIGGKENKGEDKPENKEKPSDFVKLQVLETFKKLTHKKDPYVEVVTTASSDGSEMFQKYKGVFEKIGITQLGHIHHTIRKDVLTDNLDERIGKADAVFFTGGNQLKLTALYGGTPFLTRLKERYIHEKIVIAGTSAGAMALSTPMIYAGNEEVQEKGGAIKITTGLEFLKDVCVDTHFVHRGRFVRMAQVIVTNPTCIGIGIEEDTALVVQNGINGNVIGTGMIIVIEGFDIEKTNIEDFTSDKPISAWNIKVNLLSDGDQYTIPQVNPPHK